MSAENGTEDQPKSNGMNTKSVVGAEPSESDPCMEETKTDGKVNVLHKYRDMFGERTGLSHKGVYVASGMVMLTFVLCLIVIVLAACWQRIPHRYQFPVCEKAECLRAAAQIRESLNSSVSPCENIWEAACGTWLERNPLPKDKSVWNQKQQLVKKEMEEVRNLIATLDLPLHTNTVPWKMKHLYESCMDVGNVNGDDDRPLMNIISELGGWYILRDWNDVDFDKDVLLEKLHVRYGVSPFFKISVEPNPNVPGQNNIRISPSGLGLPDKEYYFRDDGDKIQQAYKEYIRDIIIYLSTARNEATKFGNDMFYYEKRIAEITPDRVSLQNPITTYTVISISELRETNLIKFYDILLSMYKDSQITDQTEVIVTSPDYLNQIAQIISTTDRKALNGYLIWTLVREYVPYLSEKYSEVVMTFNSKLYGIEKDAERWEFCSRLVNRFMGPAVSHYREKRDHLTTKTVEVVNNTFDTIIAAVKNKMKSTSSAHGLHEHLSTKLTNLRLQLGLPKIYTNETFLKHYYQPLKIIKSNLFYNVQFAIEFQKKLEEKRLITASSDDIILELALAEVPEVAYSASDHTVVVPRPLLREPFFDAEYPSSVIYGRLGVELSQAVVTSVLPYGSVWTAEKKILSPYHMIVNDSFKSVEPGRVCLSKYIMETGTDISDIFANETALTALIHLTALDATKKALSFCLDKTPHVHQPSLENLEDQALFFLSYAQTQCSQSTRQQQYYDIIKNFELDKKTRLHLAWTQVADFSRSFGCTFDEHLQCQNSF